MWSGKGKLSLGSKEKPSECGLEGKIAARVKEEAIGKVINKKMKENERT